MNFYFIKISTENHTVLLDSGTSRSGRIKNLSELYATLKEDLIYSISIDNNIIYENHVLMNITIINYNSKSNYKLEVKINNKQNIEQKLQKYNKINVNIDNESKNNLEICLYKDNDEMVKVEKEIYCIEPYKTQFLEELENEGTVMHIRDGTRENYETSINMYKNIGGKYVREDFQLLDKYLLNKDSDYATYDKWINTINENNMKVILIMNGSDKSFAGEDGKINSEIEVEKFVEIAENIAKRYNFITKYEIINEPNTGNAYSSEEDLMYYSKLMKSLNEKLKKINPNIEISTGGNTTLEDITKKTITSEKFIELVDSFSKGKQNVFAYHPYDNENKILQNQTFYKKLISHKNLINKLGGFDKRYITEYGVSSSTSYNITEELQAQKLVQQNCILDNDGIDLKISYNFWNTSTDRYYSIRNYGLVNNDYTPKLAYYSMKNYYENTNGAEYIGTVNIAEGLEAHVYDKDGKPVIITWSENSTNNIQIDYKDFTAKDLYGKDIQPDENGKLTITTSPVYLYDVDYNYFYKAISNVAISKYDEFKEKFATEISQISDFVEKINQRQNYSQSVANTQKLMQNTAITAMKSHYELGDIILKAYEEGQLKAESVKISSMLDMINDIGNSYEDLVTVSVNNTINSVMKTLDEANVDSSELTTTKQKIDETENLINTNTDVEIIYPTKILQFSKDCYEKADYINSLEEQNDIKAGLIISNNLHAQLLANWANKFASIQINNNINDYIAQNPVTIEYSETNITNKSVKATIKTNAEIQITNNSNSKEYVFDQNGSFTFEYTIKGQAKQITAKVTNIDKTSPIINGVVDGKLYTSKITPTITDENLDTIKLILNGEEVKNFKSGTTLTEEGFYTLTAIDKAGDKTQISFQIMENNNQNYIIQDNIIKNISEQTKKSDFDNKLKLEITYKIARNDEEINEKDNIATGDVLTTSAGDKYTLIVTGDLNKDGKLNLKDLVKMRKYFLDGNNLDENEILAANCNFDGKINLKDLVKMRLIILNKESEN